MVVLGYVFPVSSGRCFTGGTSPELEMQRCSVRYVYVVQKRGVKWMRVCILQ